MENNQYKSPPEKRERFRQYSKRWRDNHLEENRAYMADYMRKWRAKNPEKIKESNHKQYLRRKALKEQEREDGRSKTES